jgi:hypothetical protein
MRRILWLAVGVDLLVGVVDDTLVGSRRSLMVSGSRSQR